MTELYLIFIGIAVVLFAGIVGWSIYQQRNIQKVVRPDYIDPLFEELEQRKAGKKETGKAGSSEMKPDAKQARSLANAEQNDAPKPRSQKAAGDTVKTGPSATNAELSVERSKVTPTNEASSTLGSRKESRPVADPQGASTTASKATLEPAPNEPPKLDAGSSIVTELVARVKNPESIEQKELLKLFRNHDFKFHRKVHIYGLNELTDLWRDIEFELPSARFVELGVAIQLADRDGAMSNKEWHDFQQMALAFSNAFDAPFEFSMDIDEALKQAQILDQIGRRYDSMAVLNVVPRAKTGFRMADIESCARDLMMSTDKNGIFVKTRGQKQNLAVLYRLACTDGSGHFGVSTGTMSPVHDLVIYMNVPATETPDRVFQDMVKDANNLATWLDGKVVDRNGKVMTQRSYTILMQQISDIAYSMQQDGLVPGDAVSKKLF